MRLPFFNRYRRIPRTILDINFLTDGYLNQLGGNPWTYARNTSGTVYGPDGTIQSAAANVLPITYDPVTLARRGFLCQEARTNLFTYSSSPANLTLAGIAPLGSGSSATALTAPDGTLTGASLLETTGSASRTIGNLAVSVASGNSYTASFYTKAGGGCRYRFISFGANAGWGSGTGATVFFDMDTVSVGYANGGATGTIESVGGGWYRLTATAACILTTAAARVNFGLTSSSTQQTYAGNGTATLAYWGGQCELGTFPTSPIPTGASQVTRSADSLSVTGAAFSALGLGATGAIVLDAINPYAAGSPSVNRGLWLSDGTANNRIGFARSSSITTPTFQVLSGGSIVSTVTGSAITAGQRRTVALAWGGGVMRAAQDGQIVGEVAMASTPTVDRLYVGGPTGTLDGVYQVRRIRAWSQALTAAQLQRASAL